MDERAARILEIRAPTEQTEGTRSQILRWLKAIGEPVLLNEPLIELETDKVTVEVPAPGSGVLQEILKHEQDDVEPGDLLGRIGVPAPAPALAPAPTLAPAPALAPAAALAPPRAPTASTAPSYAPPPPVPGPAPTSAPASAPHLLSPAVRRLLTEHSLDAASIEGSGQGGRITVQDVLRAAAERDEAIGGGGDAAGRPADAAGRAVDADGRAVDADGRAVDAGGHTAAADAEHSVPHTAVRKRIAEHMVRSLLHTAPHVTTVFEADMSAVLRHRARNRDTYASEGAPLTLTAYFLQACVTAIRAVPEINSRWTPAALEIFDSIHIGVATALQNELLVPVLRSVESLDLRETARQLNDLTTRAREGRLTPADVRGGTFTISNHGVSGSLLAAPIVINQPQSAILGIGKLEKRVIVEETPGREDRVVVQSRCYVTLTIDHRVLDGHRANQFLQSFVARLAEWS